MAALCSGRIGSRWSRSRSLLAIVGCLEIVVGRPGRTGGCVGTSPDCQRASRRSLALHPTGCLHRYRGEVSMLARNSRVLASRKAALMVRRSSRGNILLRHRFGLNPPAPRSLGFVPCACFADFCIVLWILGCRGLEYSQESLQSGRLSPPGGFGVPPPMWRQFFVVVVFEFACFVGI